MMPAYNGFTPSASLFLLLACLTCGCSDPVATASANIIESESLTIPAPPATAPIPDQTLEIPPAPEITPQIDAHTIQTVVTDFTHSTVFGAFNGAKYRLTNKGLPKNSRQTKEGYWLGSMPDPSELEELAARNVKLILTVSTVPKRELPDMKKAIQDLDLTQVYIPFGSKFPHPDRFMPIVRNYPPEQIYIHCEHGSDRTGAVLAYILIDRHQWPVPKALYSVLLPAENDIRTLTYILHDSGYNFNLNTYRDMIGIYSAERNDGYGGMKVRNETGNYINLIRTLIKRAKDQIPSANPDF